MKKATSLARPLDEEIGKDLGRRIAAEAGLQPFKPDGPRDDALRYGDRPCGRERWASAQGLEFIRVGHLFFIDEARGRGLSAELRKTLGANAIWLRDLRNSTIAGSIGDYTMLAVAALLHADLSGRHVIDAGAGEGILSLAAARLGAASLELIELDARALAGAKANLELNGLAERADFRLIEGNLSNTQGLIKRLRPGASPCVLVCNMGYWEYSATNAEGILLLALLPRAHLFVGGGYSSAGLEGLAHLKADEDLLGALGFRARPERAAMRRTTWRGTETACVLLADQGGSPRLGHPEAAKLLQQRRSSGLARRHAVGRALLPWILLAIVLLLLGFFYNFFHGIRSLLSR